MSSIKVDQSETLVKITARHDLALKLDLKNCHWKAHVGGIFSLHPLLMPYNRLDSTQI